MTEHLTDAQITELLEDFALLIGMDHDIPPKNALGHKRLELLTAGDRALRALQEHRKALREVHRRVVVDHYTGSSPDSPRWSNCRLCSGTWRYGEPELHEPTCPLAAELEDVVKELQK